MRKFRRQRERSRLKYHRAITASVTATAMMLAGVGSASAATAPKSAPSAKPAAAPTLRPGEGIPFAVEVTLNVTNVTGTDPGKVVQNESHIYTWDEFKKHKPNAVPQAASQASASTLSAAGFGPAGCYGPPYAYQTSVDVGVKSTDKFGQTLFNYHQVGTWTADGCHILAASSYDYFSSVSSVYQIRSLVSSDPGNYYAAWGPGYKNSGWIRYMQHEIDGPCIYLGCASSYYPWVRLALFADHVSWFDAGV